LVRAYDLAEPLFRWLIRHATSLATLGYISRCLSGLPRLVDLEIDCLYHPFPSLSCFSGLQGLSVSGISNDCDGLSTLIAHSPNLSQLSLEKWSYNSISPLPDIFKAVSSHRTMHIQNLSFCGFQIKVGTEMLRHLKSLQSYRLRLHKPARALPTKNDRLSWKSLRGSGINLRHLDVDCVDSALLDYLSSYSGLETFRFIPPNHHREILSQSDDLAHRFFAVVIPRHAMSLKSLFILVPPSSRWCFHNDYSNSLRHCENLDKLSQSIALNYENPLSHQSDVVSSISTLHYYILTNSTARSHRCCQESAQSSHA
jgi:hypothetical protein